MSVSISPYRPNSSAYRQVSPHSCREEPSSQAGPAYQEEPCREEGEEERSPYREGPPFLGEDPFREGSLTCGKGCGGGAKDGWGIRNGA